MSTRVFLFRLFLGIGCLAISRNFLRIAYNRARIVIDRGEGESLWQRWRSGSHRMLNGEHQKWDVLSKLCVSQCFFYFVLTTTFTLLTGHTAGEYAVFTFIMLPLFIGTWITSEIAARKARVARENVLSLPDPLELQAQKQALKEMIDEMLVAERDKDQRIIEVLTPVLATFEKVEAVMDSANTVAR